MKKYLKRISVLILALAMVFAMGITAFGAESLSDGKAGQLYDSQTEGAIAENTLTFNKDIILYNTTSATVYYPAITYAYSIATTTVEDKTVTDGDDDMGAVYPGVAAAASITSTVTFANTDNATAVTPDGKLASKPITVTIDPSKFEHSGIYRYLITETDNSTARTAAGVARGASYANTRYLDVYVRKAVADDNASTDYVVYGYVLFENTTGDVSISKAETEVAKSNGFVAKADASNKYTDTTDVDYYETFNLKVTKNIEGTLADTDHAFPFSVALASPVTTVATISYSSANTANATATITSGAATIGDATVAGYATSAIKLADGQSATIYGIPAGTTATVNEINDTYDIYKVSQESITGGTSSGLQAINKVRHEIASITTIANATTTTTNSEADTELTVKNEIAIVSPTGVIMRFAPYALILGAGIALFALSRRRRAAEED